MFLSKSNYVSFCQCSKMLWLKINKPEEEIINDFDKATMEKGTEVGKIAQKYFNNAVDVTFLTNNKPNLLKMIENTQNEITKGSTVICEASFEYDDLFCSVDILKKEKNGWAIYEVKSSTYDTKVDKKVELYFEDIAFQKYILKNRGINITNTYLMQINKDYVFDGNLNIHKLFVVSDVTEKVLKVEEDIFYNLNEAKQIFNQKQEPNFDLSINCDSPYKCGFWKYCSNHLPSPSVFDIYNLYFKDKINFYKNGFISYTDLKSSNFITNKIQLRQIDYYLNNKKTYVNKTKINEFLDTLTYPLYFLDFETVMPIVPKYVGSKPYDQIPFQYSLHYIEKKGGKLKHKEFLAKTGEDPREALAKQLCEDIPKNVCVLAYYKSFECSRIKELAKQFPLLKDHLLNIESNIKDLIIPFKNGYYYNKAMGGSFSIKSVLPAIFPNDPKLNYDNLQQVQNGTDAMTVFSNLEKMNPTDQKIARNNLLEYCKLDTYAMVKIWQELKKYQSDTKE